MSRKSCAFRDCYGSKTSCHLFPNPAKDLNRFNEWLDICENRTIFSLTPSRVYISCRVCRCHFTEDDFGPNNRLLRTAVPRPDLPYPKLGQLLYKKIQPLTSDTAENVRDMEVEGDDTSSLEDIQPQLEVAETVANFASETPVTIQETMIGVSTIPRKRKKHIQTQRPTSYTSRNLSIKEKYYKRKLQILEEQLQVKKEELATNKRIASALETLVNKI